jgi:hypothetical protein
LAVGQRAADTVEHGNVVDLVTHRRHQLGRRLDLFERAIQGVRRRSGQTADAVAGLIGQHRAGPHGTVAGQRQALAGAPEQFREFLRQFDHPVAVVPYPVDRFEDPVLVVAEAVGQILQLADALVIEQLAQPVQHHGQFPSLKPPR